VPGRGGAAPRRAKGRGRRARVPARMGLAPATTDDEWLARLPRVLLSAGYFDAIAARGSGFPPVGAADVHLIARVTRSWVRLLSRPEPIARAELESILGADAPLIDALVRLGGLVMKGYMVSSGELMAIPLFGQLAFVPSPATAPYAFFGSDVILL